MYILFLEFIFIGNYFLTRVFMLSIEGGQVLSGSVDISGSKNATLPILGAVLLLKGKVRLHCVPNIGDVTTFLDIIEQIGVSYTFENAGKTLVLDSSLLSDRSLDYDKIRKIRSSIFLIVPLLHFFGSVKMPFPGGCSIGKRSIDSHIVGLENIGYKHKLNDELLELYGTCDAGDIELNASFSVGSTENLLLSNVLREGKTTIYSAATEPHVMNLISFLRRAGAQIFIRYNHTIIVEGVANLKSDFDFQIVHDYIESGTYMIIAALAAENYITINNACLKDLYVFTQKLQESGVKIEDLGNDTVRVYRAKNLKGVELQTNIFPGFPTDLQSPFAVLMTQAEGISKIHEVMFESRLNFLVELEKMKSKLAILNPHEALIFGPNKLYGTTVTSWDLRAGAAMVIAGLIAEGTTHITNVEYIHRGYEDFVSKLQALGANIKEG